MTRSKAVCIGEGLVVLTPDSGGPLEDAGQFSRGGGGAEANVAVGLAQLGIHSFWTSRIGDDGFGRYLARTIAAAGVDVSGVVTDDTRPTGLYIKELGGDTGLENDLGVGGSRMHYYRAGSAASALSPAFLTEQPIAAVLDAADLIHTSGITPALSDSALQMTLELPSVRVPGALLSFDLNWRPRLWTGREAHGAESLARIARQSDIVLLGSDEALVVFGTDDPDELRGLFPQPHRLVVKDAHHRVIAFVGEDRVEVPALRVSVVESIGAGDAFAAGYLAGVLGGFEETASIRQGHLLAAHTLIHRGDNGPLDYGREIAPHLGASDAEWSGLHIEAAA